MYPAENTSLGNKPSLLGNMQVATAAPAHKLTTVLVIGTFFGKLPIWFPAFLLSCARNSTIEWILFTDCEMPAVSFANVRFLPMNLAGLNELASRKLGLPVQKGAFSQCDLRLAYGLIFDEYIRGFDFWAHCDIDVIWGDLRKFATKEILNTRDIISFRKDFLAGHLTLWRNVAETNSLFRNVPGAREILMSPEYLNFDESVTSLYLKDSGQTVARVHWPEQKVVWFYGDASPAGWRWTNGKLFDNRGREQVYLHFQNWKQAITGIDFGVTDEPESFCFVANGIRSRSELSGPGQTRRAKPFAASELTQTGDRQRYRAADSLRLAKRVLLVRNLDWATTLHRYSINAHEVEYDKQTGQLFLKILGIAVPYRSRSLLAGYHAAVRLVRYANAQFYNNEQGDVLVRIGNLRAAIATARELWMLKELFLDKRYAVALPPQSVVWDVRMDSGLVCLYLADSPATTVVGFEPTERAYRRALKNFALNPELGARIQPVRAEVGECAFHTIALYLPEPSLEREPAVNTDYGVGPRFEYEPIQVRDVAQVLGSIVAEYPSREIVAYLDYRHADYHVDGVSEYRTVRRIHDSGMLDCITGLLLPSPASHRTEVEAITQLLSETGFAVSYQAAGGADHGKLFAFRATHAASFRSTSHQTGQMH